MDTWIRLRETLANTAAKDVPAAELGFYGWDGWTIKAHWADIRRYFGFRECSVADAGKAAEWLTANVCEKERQAGQVREELLAHLKGVIGAAGGHPAAGSAASQA